MPGAMQRPGLDALPMAKRARGRDVAALTPERTGLDGGQPVEPRREIQHNGALQLPFALPVTSSQPATHRHALHHPRSHNTERRAAPRWTHQAPLTSTALPSL